MGLAARLSVGAVCLAALSGFSASLGSAALDLTLPSSEAAKTVAFAALPSRQRARRKKGPASGAKKSKEDKRAALALEADFLGAWGEEGAGPGVGVDALVLADWVGKLRPKPPSERTRLLTGDWRMRASDAGDLLVQLGSGLHGLPFTEMKDFFMSLRVTSKQLRCIEVLSVGPMKRNTALKGSVDLQDERLVLYYTGLVDQDGRDASQTDQSNTKRLSAQAVYIGEKALVLRVDKSDDSDREGGFAVFERLDQNEFAATLKDVTGEEVAVLPQR